MSRKDNDNISLILINPLFSPRLTEDKKRRALIECPSFSDSLGARTQDPILKRDVLYLLS